MNSTIVSNLIHLALWLALLGITGRQPSVAGMEVYTDPVTGCQYLRTGNGDSLVPRMTADGKQICGAKP